MLVKLALAVLATLSAAAPCPEGVQVVENCKQSGQVAWTFDGEYRLLCVFGAVDDAYSCNYRLGANRAPRCLPVLGPRRAPGREAEAPGLQGLHGLRLHGYWRTGLVEPGLGLLRAVPELGMTIRTPRIRPSISG